MKTYSGAISQEFMCIILHNVTHSAAQMNGTVFYGILKEFQFIQIWCDFDRASSL